ncbi:MAG: TrmH family RNA methyltransferase, partial [Oscillospiraceae bacterium]
YNLLGSAGITSKRCGLDYWHLVSISEYQNIDEYFSKNGDNNIYLATTKAPAPYHQVDMSGDVALMFGKETAGLPEWLGEIPRQMHTHPHDIRGEEPQSIKRRCDPDI